MCGGSLHERLFPSHRDLSWGAACAPAGSQTVELAVAPTPPHSSTRIPPQQYLHRPAAVPASHTPPQLSQLRVPRVSHTRSGCLEPRVSAAGLGSTEPYNHRVMASNPPPGFVMGSFSPGALCSRLCGYSASL